MDYKELHSAFMDAYRRRQYAECFRMVDHFIDGATGKDLADALVLKASLILIPTTNAPPKGSVWSTKHWNGLARV
jgi:hypothetical protein